MKNNYNYSSYENGLVIMLFLTTGPIHVPFLTLRTDMGNMEGCEHETNYPDVL